MVTDESFTNEHQSSNSGCVCCKMCGRVSENESPICNDCREKCIRRPIPLKILIPFILVVCILFVFLVTQFPKSLNAGIYYERAIKSMNQNNYVDAQNNLEKAYEIFPDSPEISGNLTICTYMNVDMSLLFQLMDEIVTKELEFKDEKLYQRLQDIYDEFDLMYGIPDEFLDNYEEIFEMSDEMRIKELNKYLQAYPDNNYIKISIADILFDQKQYDKSEELINEVLDAIPNNIIATMFRVAIQRERGQFDEAEKKCIQLLQENQQSTYVLSSLSRVELKRYNDKKSLEYMEKAYSFEPDEINVLIDLARTYYYNNKEKELNTTIDKIMQHPMAEGYEPEIQILNDIITGKTQWR